MARVVSLPQEVGEPDQYGVVGHPVEHSWSPFIHGMFARAAAQNLVYRLFDIHPDDFRRETLRLMTSGVRGLNITLPHKQAAAELVNELTPRAARAQAVNTIAFFENTTLLGDNTDGVGLITDLTRNLKIDLADKRVLILGAGGAARGVVGPLARARVAIAHHRQPHPVQSAQARRRVLRRGADRRLYVRRDQGTCLRFDRQRHIGRSSRRNAGVA